MSSCRFENRPACWDRGPSLGFAGSLLGGRNETLDLVGSHHPELSSSHRLLRLYYGLQKRYVTLQ